MKDFNLRFIYSGMALLAIAGSASITGCAKHPPRTPLLQPIEWRACPQVEYPVQAFAMKQEGVVNAFMDVDSHGKVTSVVTSGDQLFFRETVSALSQCKFPEGTAKQIKRTVSFKLNRDVSVEHPSVLETSGMSGNHSSRADQGIPSQEVNDYAGEIKSAIESRFYDARSYIGRSCTLRINLAPDGLLMKITAESGDLYLCQAAINAAQMAHIPAPPNQTVYGIFRNAALDFRL